MRRPTRASACANTIRKCVPLGVHVTAIAAVLGILAVPDIEGQKWTSTRTSVGASADARSTEQPLLERRTSTRGLFHLRTLGSDTIRRLQGVVTGSITIGGSAVTLTISTAGDTGQVTFTGTAGENLGLGITNVSLGTSTCCSSFVSVLNPDGSTLKSISAFGTNGTDVHLPVLPTTGTYTIVINPQGNTGSATLTLSDDVTGSVAVGGSSTFITIPRIGQNARVTFIGVAGENLGLGVTNVTIGPSTCCSSFVSVLKPDGSTLKSISAFGTNGTDVNLPTLPTTGTYTVFLDAQLNTGSATLTLSDDVTGSVAVGGSSTSIMIPRIGQNGRVTFSGTVGEHLGLGLTGVTIGPSTCCSSFVSVLKPDGSTLATIKAFGTNGTDVNVPTLPTTGTYTIFLDPQLNTGSVTLTLTDDVPGSVVLADPPVTFSIPSVGQNARITFDGQANQQIQITSTNTIGTGCCNAFLSILNPDGSTLKSPTVLNQSGTTTTATLGSDGTYTIFIDPLTSTGDITLPLDDLVEIGPVASDQTAETGDDTTSAPGDPQPMSPSGLVARDSYASELWTGSETGTEDGLYVVSSTASGTFALTGVALDSPTGNPIQGATVSLTDSSSNTTTTLSDSAGSFAFINMPAGVYGMSINGSGYGSYQVLNYNYESDTESRVTAELDSSNQIYDESTVPGDSSLSASSAAVAYGSQTRVPPSIRVGFVNRDSYCNRTSVPPNPVVRNYKWDFYVLQVLGPEVGVLGLNEIGMKAFEAVVQNFAWYHRIHRRADVAGGADVDNSTSFQCFKPEFPVRKEVMKNWRIWLHDVLPYRVAAPGGNLQLTQYRAGSGQFCSGDPGFPTDGNILSQNDLVPMSQSCGYADWKPIVNYFYTGRVVAGKAPPNPTTSFSRVPGGVTLNFVSKVGGSPVAWSYVLQRSSPSGWRTIYKKGWSRVSRSIPTSFTFMTTSCYSYRVKAVNPVGSSVFSSYNGGSCITPG